MRCALFACGPRWSPFRRPTPARRHRGNLRGHQHPGGDRETVGSPPPSLAMVISRSFRGLRPRTPISCTTYRRTHQRAQPGAHGRRREPWCIRRTRHRGREPPGGDLLSRCALDAQGHLLRRRHLGHRHPIRRGDLGLAVTQTDFVPQGRDVLVRRYQVQRQAASPVSRAWLLSYATSRLAFRGCPRCRSSTSSPICAMTSSRPGDRQRGAAIHFHPGNTGLIQTLADAFTGPIARDFGPLGT